MPPVFSGGLASQTAEVATILIEDRSLMARVLGLESEPYSGNWGIVNTFDSLTLYRKIHAAV